MYVRPQFPPTGGIMSIRVGDSEPRALADTLHGLLCRTLDDLPPSAAREIRFREVVRGWRPRTPRFLFTVVLQGLKRARKVDAAKLERLHECANLEIMLQGTSLFVF